MSAPTTKQLSRVQRAYLLGLRRGRQQARAELRAIEDELAELHEAIEQQAPLPSPRNQPPVELTSITATVQLPQVAKAQMGGANARKILKTSIKSMAEADQAQLFGIFQGYDDISEIGTPPAAPADDSRPPSVSSALW